MARSINTDDIGFRHLKKKIIPYKHDDTKIEKGGEKYRNKNLHDNPNNPNKCLFKHRNTPVYEQ